MRTIAAMDLCSEATVIHLKKIICILDKYHHATLLCLEKLFDWL